MHREIRNAKIRSTSLDIEDHGVLTAHLHLDYGGGGQGFGGYGLDEWIEEKKKRVGCAWGMEFIRRILETLEVDSWEKLPGTPLRADAEQSKVHGIGHYLKDKWFYPAKDLEFLRVASVENKK